jgi:hypothetical protein
MKTSFNFSNKELLRVVFVLLGIFILLLMSAGRLAELLDPGIWSVVSAITQLFGVLLIAILLGGIYFRIRHPEIGNIQTEDVTKRNIRDEILILRELFQNDQFLKAYRLFERHHTREGRPQKPLDPRAARSAMVAILRTFNLLRALLEEEAIHFKLVVAAEGYMAFRLREYTRQVGSGNRWYEDPITEWKDAFSTWDRLVDSWIEKVVDAGRSPPGAAT